MLIKSFAEAESVLSNYIPEHGLTDEVYTLTNMRKLMGFLGDPQNQLKVIHIAGTSGKTSTAYYIAALLKSAGKNVGMTISPHISQINERLQLNLKPMPETEYCLALSNFIDVIEKCDVKPTYFELLVAFAFWEFARRKVDYAVVEVGLGGLLDGTNVINRADKICVITDIGLDHVQKLGRTLPKIAAQKAGIITENNVVFSYRQSSEVMDVIQEKCYQKRASLHAIRDTNTIKTLNFLPLFQRRNFLLARATFNYVAERDHLFELNDAAIIEAANIEIPGRMEMFNIDGKVVILDGAHNAQKLSALADAVQDKFPKDKIAVLLSFSSKPSGAIDEILRLSKDIIVTSFKGGQELKKRSIGSMDLVTQLRASNINVKLVSNPEAALEDLLATPERVVLVTGSFYLLNIIRPMVLNK